MNLFPSRNIFRSSLLKLCPHIKRSIFVLITKPLIFIGQSFTYNFPCPLIIFLDTCAHTHPGVAHCTILLQSSHCVEVPVEEEVVAAQARTLNSAPVGKVAIYVLRPYAQQRNTVSQVFVDDRLAATLGPMTFFRIVAEQGTHRIRIETTGVANREYEISGDATTYLQYQLSETFTTVRGEITEQTEAQARARVARLDLVKSAGALP
ncbi:hypothetical protein [Herbaspirillum huttiense]|uniref:hypothetical protein n=1 Tax=Herbaspirillum huttiense TaxID=863372 RepID=UPI0039AF8C41